MPQPDRAARSFNERLTVPLLGLSVVFVVMNSSMFNLALPRITNDLGLTTEAASWIVTGFSIIFAVSTITYSRLADFVPIRKLLPLGLFLFGSASVIGFISDNYAVLLLARLLQATGCGAVPGLGVVLITRFVPLDRRGRAMSVLMSSSALGFGLGPVAGGAIVQYAGWNYLFIVSALVWALVPIFYRLIPAETPRKGVFDWQGAALVGTGTACLLLFLSERQFYFLAAGLLGLVLFGWRIRRAPQPFVLPYLFRNKRYLSLGALSVAGYFASFSALFVMPQILIHYYRLEPGHAGLLIFPGALVAMLGSRRIGTLIDRYGNKLLLRILPLSMLAAIFVFALFQAQTYYAIMIAYMLFSVSFAPMITSVSNEMSRLLPKEQVGSGVGLMQLMQYFSGAFGVSLSTGALVWSRHLSPDRMYANAFWLIAIVVISGVACSLYYVGRMNSPSRS